MMATKALVSIAIGAGVECLIVEAWVDRAFLQCTNEIIFNDEDMEVGHLDHRRPFYLTTFINLIPIKRALVNMGASINVIPLNMLQVARILESKIQGCPMEVTGFGGRGKYTVGYIQLWMKVGPIASLA